MSVMSTMMSIRNAEARICQTQNELMYARSPEQAMRIQCRLANQKQRLAMLYRKLNYEQLRAMGTANASYSRGVYGTRRRYRRYY